MRGVLRRGQVTLAPNWNLGHDVRAAGIFDAEIRILGERAALGAKEVAVKEAFETGAYFSSIHFEIATGKRGEQIGRVVADDFKAGWIERGHRTVRGQGTGRKRLRNLQGTPSTGFVKGRNILRRGARRAGLRVRGPRKRPLPM